MTKPETENQLKKIVKNQVEHYFNKTFEKQDLSRLDAILLRLGVSDIETARVQLHREIKATQKEMDLETWLLIALAVSAFAWMGFAPRKLELSQCLGMIYVLLGLLFVGVTTPMIDMEAKISQMSFVLLDHPIEFVNQVLYFQTKSILDVFWIMITHSFLQMKVVGILMITFSIFFPLLKMFCSVGYYKNYRNAQERRWVKFFVLKSGKWSMSDVLVVAIFMAYIGFNGIITSQLGNLSAVDQDIVLLTTNGTSLQPGFYIFLTYTMLALFLSSLLSKRREECS